jgi:ankyrin repeat protein
MNDPECARELLSRGADPNRLGPRGISALGNAIISLGEEDMTLPELLLEYGAKLESDLFFYALGRRVALPQFKTSFLLGKGLDPNISHATWGTLLHYAIRNHQTGAIKVLDAGADRTVRSEGTQNYGETPLEMAEEVRNPNIRSAIISLLQSGQERDVLNNK